MIVWGSKGVEFLSGVEHVRPLLQVGEFPESNTCLEKIMLRLIGLDGDKLHPTFWAGSRRG